MPMGFPVDGFESALRYDARPEDIFISTYPKCGTTWMQHLVWLILNGGEPLGPEQKMTEVIPHLEEVGAEVVGRLPDPRVIKTHLPVGLVRLDPWTRVIYVARNPFDCAVSFFHHTRGFVNHYDFAGGTFEDYLECFISGEVDFGDYFENVSGWLARRGERRFLLTTYERMSEDSGRVVRDVAEFLGPALRRAVADEELMAKILRHSGFAAMSKDQLRWASARPEGMPPFVRRGVVGDWKTYFSPEGARRLIERVEACPAALTMEAIWPDIMAEARDFARG